MKRNNGWDARDLAISTCFAGVLSAILSAWPMQVHGENAGLVAVETSLEETSLEKAMSEKLLAVKRRVTELGDKAAKPTQEAGGPAALEFAVGDRLSIRLFERLVPNDGTGAWSSLIEFPEVSGEYVIQEDGTVFLPLLGELSFANQTQQVLREEVSRRFQHSHGGAVEFIVRIVERDPIYMTGAVTNPGAYRHVPGMTVLHALTLAGGPLGAGADVWRRFDLARERERLRQTELALARLDAKSAVLEAEATDREPNPPPSLVAMVGKKRSAELLQEALDLRALERQRINAERETFKLIIDTLDAELAVMKEALVEAEKGIELRTKRVETVAGLHNKGLANEATYNVAGDALSDARKNWHETRMAFVHVQRSLVEAQQEERRIILDDNLERERERVALRAQLADHKATREMISQMLLSAIAYGPSPTDGEAEIIVLRRSVDGVAEIRLDERAPLQPGDLIEIQVTPRETGAVAIENPLRPW